MKMNKFETKQAQTGNPCVVLHFSVKFQYVLASEKKCMNIDEERRNEICIPKK